MASNVRALVERIVTDLRAINGTGSYTYDLTDTADRVLLGVPDMPSMLPQIWVQDVQWAGAHGTAMGTYARTLEVTLVGVVGGNGDTPGFRFLAASDLLNDICLKLEADRTLNGNALDLVVKASTAFDGLQMGEHVLGAVGVVVEVKWRPVTGT